MRNSPKSILIFMLTCLFFVCTAQSQAIIPRHQDLPQWSPDGEKYACVETGLNEGVLESQIRIYQVSWETETQVTASLFGLGDLAEETLPEGTVDDDPIVAFFSWAPDSEHYVFTSSTPVGYDLFIGNLSGDVYLFYPKNDSQADLFPRWSPNKEGEQYITYMREGKIFLQEIKEEGGKFKPEGNRIPILPEGCVESLLPEWSPDGQKLAFSALTEEGNYDIYLYETGEGKPHRLTNTPDIQEYHPVWSPDGKWIAVYSKHKDAASFEISIIKTDKSTLVTKQIRPKRGRNFGVSNPEILLVDCVHHSMILGPAWMPSSRHLVYVRPDDNAIMIVEFSPGDQKVAVQRRRIGAITTQLNADVQCSPTEAKLIFSHYAPAGGGVAYRNLKTHQLKKEKREFKLQVSSGEQFTKNDGIELRIEGLAYNIHTEGSYERSLSWNMKCAVGDVVRGLVECPGYHPKEITLPVLRKMIEKPVELELPEVDIEMWVVNQDYESIGGVEVFLNGDRLSETKKGYITEDRKLRITYPIIDEIIEQIASKEHQTEQEFLKTLREAINAEFTHQISSEVVLSKWGIKSLEIRDSPYREILSNLEVIVPAPHDSGVKKLYLIAMIQVPETKISFLVKNWVGEPIPGIGVKRVGGSEVKLKNTDENGVVDLVLKELEDTEIKLTFTQPKENPDYQDLDILFSTPKKDEQLKIRRDGTHGPALVKNEDGKWVVTLDSVKENVKIPVTDDAGHLQLHTLHVVVQNQHGQPIDEVASLSLKDKDNGDEILKIDSLPAEGTVEIKALHGKFYYLIVKIEQEKTFSDPPNPLNAEFLLKPLPDSPPFQIFPINTRRESAGLKMQDKTMYIEFQTDRLVSLLNCVYPNNVPIANKEVKYKNNRVGVTDKDGKIRPKFLTMEEAKNLTVKGYPLRSQRFVEKDEGVTKLLLDIPHTILTIFVEDTNGKEIEGVKITALGIKNQAGDELYKFSTEKGAILMIYRLPGDTVTLSFSKGEDNQAEVEVKLKPGGGIKKVKDSRKIIAKIEEKGKKLVVKYPSRWKKTKQQK